MKKICVLGATGYVGGRLVPKLLSEGCDVRACSRSIDKLKSRYWADHSQVELCRGDVHDPEDLNKVLQGVEIAYYLVHSMNPQSADFEDADRKAAQNMVEAAEACGVRRIIYLGGLGKSDDKLSKHLKSRHEVADILRSGNILITVLRAAMIIGSGSASFEILRYLVDRLPIMVTPRWVNTPSQPIGIRNVVDYLYGCAMKEETCGESYDIGGAQILNYRDLMRIYAEEAGLPKRLIIPVPVLTPRLSSLWIHLVTPVPSYIARPLAEGLSNPVVCQDNRIKDIIPLDLYDCRRSIQKALKLVVDDNIKTHWADAGRVPYYAQLQDGDPYWAGGTVLDDKRCREINASCEDVWKVIARIGGETGWYHGTWLWMLRGFIDRLVGGVGARRGRRSQTMIAVGDILDFWRVVSVKDEDHLKLAAEMKLPGVATLEFRLEPKDENQCVLFQKARFHPHGLFGIIYWYCLIPLHEYVFGGMIRKIARRAEDSG